MSPGSYTPSMKQAVPGSTPNCTPASMLDGPRITGRSVVRPKACEKESPVVSRARSSMDVSPCSSIECAANAETATGLLERAPLPSGG